MCFFGLDGWLDFLMLFFLGRLKRGMWDCFWTVKWCFLLDVWSLVLDELFFEFGYLVVCSVVDVLFVGLLQLIIVNIIVNYFKVNVNVSLWITVVSA